MIDAKQMVDWDHTSELKAFIYNSFKDRSQPAVSAQRMNPYREQSKELPFGHLKARAENYGNGRSHQGR